MKFGRCITPRCRNTKAPGRRLCHTCRSRKYRQNNPFRYRYNNLKTHAKTRNIPFKLTFSEFTQLWTESGKWGALLAGERWSVDRIDVNRGYEADNVRIISIYLNVQIWHDSQKWQVDFRWRERWAVTHNKGVDECPF